MKRPPSSRGMRACLQAAGAITFVAGLGGAVYFATLGLHAGSGQHASVAAVLYVTAAGSLVGGTVGALPWFALARMLTYGQYLAEHADRARRSAAMSGLVAPPGDRLALLTRLREAGVLTGEEFLAAKQAMSLRGDPTSAALPYGTAPPTTPPGGYGSDPYA